MRSPGASAALTASAVPRRTSRSAAISLLNATSSATGPAGAVTCPTAGSAAPGRVDLDRGGELLEQARPGPCAGERLLGKDLLLGLTQQVLAVAARVAQVVAAEVEALAREQLLARAHR